MKKLIFVTILSFVLLGFKTASADEWIKGYYRSDGTYVQSHYRSSPNSSKWDNYSSKDNINPYNGKKGYNRHEFSTPSIYYYDK